MNHVRNSAYVLSVVLITIQVNTTVAQHGSVMFLSKTGVHKLYDGRLQIEVCQQTDGLNYTITHVDSDGLSIGVSPTKSFGENADWFIYPESLNNVWVFTGKELYLWVYEEKDGRSTRVLQQASRHSELLKKAPMRVQMRLPNKLPSSPQLRYRVRVVQFQRTRSGGM